MTSGDAPARVETTFPAEVRAGSLGRWTVRVIAAAPLAAGARLALARRWPSDWGIAQARDRAAVDFTAVAASTLAPLRWWTAREPTWHPFDHVLHVELLAPLAAGAAVEIRYGDGAGGSPGARAQTFIEEASPLSVRLREAADAGWTELARPATRVVGAAPHRLVATAPSVVVAGEEFSLHVRVEDEWGNPASDVERRIAVDGAAGGARGVVTGAAGSWTRIAATLAAPGIHRLALRDESGALRAETNPVRCVAAAPARRPFWGDIHAQSVIGCGARTVANFYRHARDFAGCDFASHQANCFLVSNPEWEETERVTAEFNEDGRFATLLGVEWSAQYALGGDHNLYFPGDRAELRRCAHTFVADRSDEASDLRHVADLHRHYAGTETLVGVHVGGRTTNFDWHAPGLERLLEVHSTHATSEWFLFDALRRGYRFGVTAGSDGVDGRPGASHPGHLHVRNVRGGLVAVAMPGLSRAALWEALRARRCYATTGERILLEFDADGRGFGEEYATSAAPRLAVAVEGTAPLTSVEIFRGVEPVFAAPLAPADPRPSAEIRVAWSGLTQPGNFERARMAWHGHLALAGARVADARGWAFDTPDEGIRERSATRVAWRSLTGGDWDGVIVTLADEAPDATLEFVAEPMTLTLPLVALARGPFSARAADPAREVRVDRLPRAPAPPGWRGAFVDEGAPPGTHAYWVRVRQEDGAFAWSSPVWITVRR